MPAKRPAPKSAKGKKAASRPPARKALARKPEPARARTAAAASHARKSAVAPKKPATAAVPAESPEVKKPLRPVVVATAVAPAPRPATPAEGDDGETLEPGSL